MRPVVLSGFADEISSDPGEQLATLKDTGLCHLELRGVGGRNVLDLSTQEIAEFRQQLDDAGIGVSAIGSPIGKVQVRSDMEAHYSRFLIAVERAHQFDSAYVRIFSFYHKDETADEVRAVVVEQLQRMVEHAEQEGVILVHENEKGIYGDVTERCVDLLQSADNPHLRAVFDAANFIQSGVEPSTAWPALKPFVDYFHIKDAVAESGRVVPAGHCDAELEAILGDAVKSGFCGFLSLEPHLKADDPEFGGSGPERFARAVAELRRLLDRLGVEVE